MGSSDGQTAQGVLVDVLRMGQKDLLNNVVADTMVLHREEGPKEHCLFYEMNDHCIPLQSPRSKRCDHE